MPAVMIALCAACCAAGYALGMLHMRRNYLDIIRREKRQHSRLMRHAERMADGQRRAGFAAGYCIGRDAGR